MPLPPNGTLSLHGPSRPGDPVQSKPKQAMIVRMSAETLEALAAFPQQPQMDFQFGDTPGIYIRDTFYPTRSLKESTHHELYLRASSAAKPMAPLKLYANVTGKLIVERELSKVSDELRKGTLGAVQQRSARQTILVDTLPDLPAVNGRKRKAQAISMFRKPIQQTDGSRIASSSSSALPARVASPIPRPSPIPGKDVLPVRKRLVHCLAVAERMADEVVRLVAGPDADPSSRRDVLELLDEVGEQVAPGKKGDKSPRLWRLKPKSWLEVRPYEWPKLTEQERTQMARLARLAFKTLNIPESDPVWTHVTYRSTTGNFASGAHTQQSAVASRSATVSSVKPTNDTPKRGVSSVDIKRKAKPKVDTNSEILMKDESVKPSSKVGRIQGKDTEEGEITSSPVTKATAPSRRLPGSGFKLPKNALQEGKVTSRNQSGSSTASKQDAADLRKRDREPQNPLLPAKPVPPISQQSRVMNGMSQPAKPKKAKEVTAVDSDRERVRGDRERDRAHDRGRERDQGSDWDMDRELTSGAPERGRDSPKVKADAPSIGVKRKKSSRDHEYDNAPLAKHASAKRQKIDSDLLHSPPVSVPKKELNTPRTKAVVQRDISPTPSVTSTSRKKADTAAQPPTHHTSSTKAPVSTQSTHTTSTSKCKSSGSAKPRRKSPIYTSTEDEAEPGRPLPKTNVGSTPLPNPATSSRSLHHAQPMSRARPPRPLPTDHAALRAQYSTSYLEYLNVFQKVCAQRNKIESLLKNSGHGSVGSITDSDDEVELMDAEELRRLSAKHRMLEKELESMQQIFASGKSESPSD